MKKFFIILLVIILLLVMAFFAGDWRDRDSSIGKIRECPDEKIINRMPGPDSTGSEYYVVKGERKEVADYDAMWVAQNCQVAEQTVY